jgi:hypothetical protein
MERELKILETLPYGIDPVFVPIVGRDFVCGDIVVRLSDEFVTMSSTIGKFQNFQNGTMNFENGSFGWHLSRQRTGSVSVVCGNDESD